MPTSLLIGAATGAASAGASSLANKVFGPNNSGSSGLTDFKPAGINAGGLTSSFDNSTGNIGITPSAERLGLVRNVSDTFSGLSGEFGQMRPMVAPGVSALRASRLQEVENARQNAVGNLRENLQRRRVLGSSFGQDALTRAEAEFGQQKDRVAAESFLQELELTNQLIQQEYGARRSAFQTLLDELNLEADTATKLAGKATETLGKNAQVLAELNARESAAAGKFFGDTFGSAFKDSGLKDSVKSFFSNSGGGGAPLIYGPGY